MSGHRTESVYRRYDIINGRDLQAAGERMQQYFSRQKVTKGDSEMEGEAVQVGDKLGWVVGFEPTTTGITSEKLIAQLLDIIRGLR